MFCGKIEDPSVSVCSVMPEVSSDEVAPFPSNKFTHGKIGRPIFSVYCWNSWQWVLGSRVKALRDYAIDLAGKKQSSLCSSFGTAPYAPSSIFLETSGIACEANGTSSPTAQQTQRLLQNSIRVFEESDINVWGDAFQQIVLKNLGRVALMTNTPLRLHSSWCGLLHCRR